MKQKHKLVAFTIGISLIGSLSQGAVFASDGGSNSAAVVSSATAPLLSQDQAMKIAQNAFSLDSSWKLQNVSQNHGNGNSGGFANGARNSWGFTWTKGDTDNQAYLNVTIDSTSGDILNMNQFYRNGYSNGGQQNEISSDTAKSDALAWIQKLAPSKTNEIDKGTLMKNGSTGRYNFKFNRVVNGISFPTDGFNVTISSHGDLLNYNYNWSVDDAQFPSPSGMISLDSATQTFSKLPLTLSYQQEYMPGAQQPIFKLVYTSSLSLYPNGNQLPVVNAVYGNLEWIQDSPVAGSVYSSVYSITPITSTPGDPVASSPIETADAATQIAIKLLGLDSSYTMSDSSFNEMVGGNQRATWNLTFTQTGSDGNISDRIYCIIDANNGNLLEFGHNLMQPPTSSTSDSSSTLTKDQAVQAAENFLKKVAPTQTNQLALLPQQQQSYFKGGTPSDQSVISFVELVNGIPLQNGNVTVVLNKKSGQVISYNNYSPNPISSHLPNPAQAVSLQTAEAAFVKEFPLHLVYQVQRSMDPQTGKWTTSLPELVYASDNTSNYGQQSEYDAITGQFFTMGGANPEPVKVTDIKGHWAEKQLQDFANRGIIQVKDGKVNPDQGITRDAALHILLLALQDPYLSKFGGAQMSAGTSANTASADVQAASASGWINQDLKNFRPNDWLTRQNLADFGVHIMGYSKLASDNNLFKSPFQDIDSNNPELGEIAVMKGLGIMMGDTDGNFHPNDQVTLAQVVVVADRIAKLNPHGVVHPF